MWKVEFLKILEENSLEAERRGTYGNERERERERGGGGAEVVDEFPIKQLPRRCSEEFACFLSTK